MERLVSHIAAMNDESLPLAFLEDMALCAAWLESHHDDPAEQARFPTLRDRIDQWVECADPVAAGEVSAGSRQQPILRAYVNDLIRGKIGELARDELDFVYLAWVLSERSKMEGLFERSLECLRPFIRQLEKARAATSLCPGLPNLSGRVAHYDESDMRKAEPRDVKIFAGIEATVRGPVLMHTGDVKIVGDIPVDCTVVVEDGSCYVRGGVQGKLAATKNCEVMGAISGIVVTRRGHVRCGTVVNPARVISKEGSVSIIYGEAPRLIFAANDLTIARGAIGGKYRANSVKCEGPVEGGEFHVSGRLGALRLDSTGERVCQVVLRRILSCRDYGEVLTHESTRLLTNAMHIRHRIGHLRGMMALTEREADDYAGAVLSFITGAESTPARIQNVQQLRRGVAYIDRLEVAMQSLIKSIEDQLALNDNDRDSVSDSHDVRVDVRLLIEDLESDLGLLSAEGPIHREVLDYREVVTRAAKQLQRAFVTEHQVILELQSLLRLQQTLDEKREELERLQEQGTEVVVDSSSQAAVLEKARQNQARVDLLVKLLESARKGQGTETLRKRCQDRYVKLMQRNIENRRARAIEYATNVRKLENDISLIRAKLWREYRVSLPRHVVEQLPDTHPEVEAVFSDGVRILAWTHQLDSNAVDPSSMVVTKDSEGEMMRYYRLGHGAIRSGAEPAVEPRRRGGRR